MEVPLKSEARMGHSHIEVPHLDSRRVVRDECIDPLNVVAGIQQVFADMRADETGRPRHNEPHGFLSLHQFRPSKPSYTARTFCIRAAKL